jgi:hypothetical protein
MKRRLYLQKGALEFWFCDESGQLTFFGGEEPMAESKLCPNFPKKIGE